MIFLTDGFEKVDVGDSRRPRFFRHVRMDLRAKSIWYDGRANGILSMRMLLSDGSLCTLTYRLMFWLRRWRLGLLAAVLCKLNAMLTGAVIGAGADFGPGLIILHSVGVVINKSVKAGSNVVIEGGVTMGAEKGRSPVLGDNVFLGAGARVVGGVRIGNDVRIGANAVVVKDIPDGATAVGVPAKVVRIRDTE